MDRNIRRPVPPADPAGPGRIVFDGYESLASVLYEALDQAQAGKGRNRHASGEPFEEQPIVSICENLGSNQGAIFQAHKKSHESLRLSHEQARAELLGAINYLAAAIIVLDRANRKTENVGQDGKRSRDLTGDS